MGAGWTVFLFFFATVLGANVLRFVFVLFVALCDLFSHVRITGRTADVLMTTTTHKRAKAKYARLLVRERSGEKIVRAYHVAVWYARAKHTRENGRPVEAARRPPEHGGVVVVIDTHRVAVPVATSVDRISR